MNDENNIKTDNDKIPLIVLEEETIYTIVSDVIDKLEIFYQYFSEKDITHLRKICMECKALLCELIINYEKKEENENVR